MTKNKVKFCPFCGSKNTTKVGRMKNCEHFGVYACFDCKIGYYLYINPKKVVTR